MEKYIVLQILNLDTSLEAGLINILSEYKPVRKENNFILGCSKAVKDRISEKLILLGIQFILIYVNTKFGGDVIVNGINVAEKNILENIILYK